MDYLVPDMSCGHCKAAIETAIAGAGGRAQVDLAQKRVTVDGLSPDRAEAVLREAGFPPQPAP